MAVPILIATASPGFGELIRKTLEDAGSYQPFLAANRSEVMQQAQRPDLALAILDSNLDGFPLLELIKVLRGGHPGIKLIAIPPRETSQDKAFNFPPVDGYLNKPFYLPDLLSIINNAIQGLSREPTGEVWKRRTEQSTQGIKPAQTESGWQYDVRRAAQQLTRLSFEVSAQAALLIRDGQLWAYSGQLPQEAARELAQFVIQDRENNIPFNTSSGDLARFIKLETTGDETMLYAMQLEEVMILVLAFDAQTPFSRIRAQAARLARALSSPDLPEEQLSAGQDEATFLAQLPPEKIEEADDEPELQIPAMFPKGFVPPPIITPQQTDQLAEAPTGVTPASLAPDQAEPLDWEPDVWTYEQELAARQGPAVRPPHESVLKNIPAPQPVPVSTSPPAAFHSTNEIQVPETIQIQNTKMYNLSYACVLIPRLPQHTLTGDLGRRMGEWLQTIHLAFGWRLAHLAVRPSYLLWVSAVSPRTSAASLIKTVRKQTSGWIFLEFPRVERDNPSCEFWAPGYMAITTGQLPSAEELQVYIQNTRSRQGIAAIR
jgi:DNA-binding response OmpR family regulator/REP element-mobilizing transposase RayT